MDANYDAWLEQPFQDMCKAADDFENACELYNDTDSYWEGLDDFLKENPGLDEGDWRDSSHYDSCVDSYWRMLNEPPEPPEDFEYRERW
jgi:hypothetical protein